jgi:hypothetical protein
MDADRQAEKNALTEEQKKALVEKLRMHEEAGMTPIPDPKPQFFPPPPKKKVTSI